MQSIGSQRVWTQLRDFTLLTFYFSAQPKPWHKGSQTHCGPNSLIGSQEPWVLLRQSLGLSQLQQTPSTLPWGEVWSAWGHFVCKGHWPLSIRVWPAKEQVQIRLERGGPGGGFPGFCPSHSVPTPSLSVRSPYPLRAASFSLIGKLPGCLRVSCALGAPPPPHDPVSAYPHLHSPESSLTSGSPTAPRAKSQRGHFTAFHEGPRLTPYTPLPWYRTLCLVHSLCLAEHLGEKLSWAGSGPEKCLSRPLAVLSPVP